MSKSSEFIQHCPLLWLLQRCGVRESEDSVEFMSLPLRTSPTSAVRFSSWMFTTPFPHISGVISRELWVVDSLAGEGGVRNFEEVEDLALEVGELGVEGAEGEAMVEDGFALS